MAKFFDTWRSGGTGIGSYLLLPKTTSSVPLVIQGLTGQTSNLIEAKNSIGTTVFSVDNSGNVTYLGDEYVTDQFTVNGNASVAGTLDITGAATINSTLSVADAVTFDNGLTVNGNTVFDDETTIHSLTVQGEVKLESGYIRTKYNADLHLLPSSSCITIIGDAGTTSQSLNSNDDLFVSGKLEVDGTAYFDGEVTIGTQIIVPFDTVKTDATAFEAFSVAMPENSVMEIQFFSTASAIFEGTQGWANYSYRFVFQRTGAGVPVIVYTYNNGGARVADVGGKKIMQISGGGSVDSATITLYGSAGNTTHLSGYCAYQIVTS